MSEMQLYRKKLRTEFLFPKIKLRKERLSRELTTSYMAQLIGLTNRFRGTFFILQVTPDFFGCF